MIFIIVISFNVLFCFFYIKYKLPLYLSASSLIFLSLQLYVVPILLAGDQIYILNGLIPFHLTTESLYFVQICYIASSGALLSYILFTSGFRKYSLTRLSPILEFSRHSLFALSSQFLLFLSVFLFSAIFIITPERVNPFLGIASHSYSTWSVLDRLDAAQDGFSGIKSFLSKDLFLKFFSMATAILIIKPKARFFSPSPILALTLMTIVFVSCMLIGDRTSAINVVWPLLSLCLLGKTVPLVSILLAALVLFPLAAFTAFLRADPAELFNNIASALDTAISSFSAIVVNVVSEFHLTLNWAVFFEFIYHDKGLGLRHGLSLLEVFFSFLPNSFSSFLGFQNRTTAEFLVKNSFPAISDSGGGLGSFWGLTGLTDFGILGLFLYLLGFVFIIDSLVRFSILYFSRISSLVVSYLLLECCIFGARSDVSSFKSFFLDFLCVLAFSFMAGISLDSKRVIFDIPFNNMGK